MALFKNDRLNLLFFTIFNLVLRSFRINSPPQAYFDEKAFYLEGARSYLTGFADPNPEHPPLGKEIIALGMKIFGDNLWGWRLPSVIFGTIGILMTYLLAKKLFGSTKIAFASAFLLTFDFMWFVHSRIGLLEIFLATFSLIAVYFLWDYYQREFWKSGLWFGVFTGLAISVKWTEVFLLAAALILLGIKVVTQKGKIRVSRVIFKIILILMVIFGIYWSSFQPYLKGHDFSWFWQRQVKMWAYHTQEIKPNASGSLRPEWWVFDPLHSFYTDKQSQSYIVSFANPLLFWGGLLSFFYLFFKNLKKWEPATGFLVLLVFTFWWPWFLVGRYTFFYYFLTALPFLAIILAQVLVERKKTASRLQGLLTMEMLLTGNALAFILIYPLLTALPVASWYLTVLFGNH